MLQAQMRLYRAEGTPLADPTCTGIRGQGLSKTAGLTTRDLANTKKPHLALSNSVKSSLSGPKDAMHRHSIRRKKETPER